MRPDHPALGMYVDRTVKQDCFRVWVRGEITVRGNVPVLDGSIRRGANQTGRNESKGLNLLNLTALLG